MSNQAVQKTLDIIGKVFSWIVIAITVFMMVFTLFSTLTFDKNDRNLFGFRFYIVLTDSMSLSENNKDDDVHLDAGDIVIIKNASDPAALQPKETIAFISQNSESFGETVTHMIREVRKTADGRVIGYVTYGTNTGTNDEALVEPAYVLGTYAGRLPRVGHFFQFLKSTQGYVVCILIPFLILIGWQGIKTFRLFRLYKSEQMADMEAERAEIAKEREMSAQMMRELQELREQLARQAGVEAPPTDKTGAELQETDSSASSATAEGGTESGTDGSDVN